MKISAVMIARNEAHNVRECFESFWDHVDEVVLCDTGSRDGTIGEARRFARERRESGKLIVGRFKWCDDFAAARNYAHALASGDVHIKFDLDERLCNGQHLGHAASLLLRSPDLDGMASTMQPSQGDFGTAHHLRLFRAPVEWQNPTHEMLKLPGGRRPRVECREEISIRHTRQESHGRRDLDIALAWARAEPDNPLPWRAAAQQAYLLVGEGELTDRELVQRCCERALEAGPSDPEDTAMLFLYWGSARFRDWKDSTGARRLAHRGLECLPDVPSLGRLVRDPSEQPSEVRCLLAMLLAMVEYASRNWREALLAAADAAVFATTSHASNALRLLEETAAAAASAGYTLADARELLEI